MGKSKGSVCWRESGSRDVARREYEVDMRDVIYLFVDTEMVELG